MNTDDLNTNYAESIKDRFAYYKLLGEKTFVQLSDEELFWQYNKDSNSIAVIVKHLWGNMLSRWTDFLTSDGEKPWRKRDAEFQDTIKNKGELLAKWEEGWQCLFKAIEELDSSTLAQTLYIRQEKHTVVEAINRQLTHYAYHVGQIVYIGKMTKGKDWNSLTIPKGESARYNKEKFSKNT